MGNIPILLKISIFSTGYCLFCLKIWVLLLIFSLLIFFKMSVPTQSRCHPTLEQLESMPLTLDGLSSNSSQLHSVLEAGAAGASHNTVTRTTSTGISSNAKVIYNNFRSALCQLLIYNTCSCSCRLMVWPNLSFPLRSRRRHPLPLIMRKGWGKKSDPLSFFD